MSWFLNVQISTRHRLNQLLLNQGYSRMRTGQALVKITGLTISGTSEWTYGMSANASARRALVHIDANGETYNWTKIYINGSEADRSLYEVDHENGLFVFAAPPGGPVTADFREWIPSIREGYPTQEELNLLFLPVVAYKFDGMRSQTIGIGHGAKLQKYRATIDILANSESELLKMAGGIHEQIRLLPILDFKDAQPLGYGGRIDPQFSRQRQFVSTARWLEEPSISILNKRRDGTDKERWRAMVMINFDFCAP